MTQSFVPQDHLIKIPRRVKTASGAWETVHDDYLEVKWRLVMFRERYPHGRITTEEVCVDLDRGYARFKATIEDGEGGLATGYGTETKAGFADYCERAETRALGRSLAALGFGTQFVGADLDELPHVADAPVTTTAAPDAAHETTGISHPLPVGEEGTPGAATPSVTNGHSTAPEHPTESHLAALRNLAVTECGDPVEVYEDRLRTTMKIPKQASVAPKFLTRTMSMAQYMDVFTYYRRFEAQLAKGKETPGGTASTPQPTPQSAPATTEAPPAVPSPAGSLSAPESAEVEAAERDRQRLRKEVAQWDLRVSPEEIEHVIQHNPYSKARALLWNCRRKSPAATPIESAAD
jgi:hypothetical protein